MINLGYLGQFFAVVIFFIFLNGCGGSPVGNLGDPLCTFLSNEDGHFLFEHREEFFIDNPQFYYKYEYTEGDKFHELVPVLLREKGVIIRVLCIRGTISLQSFSYLWEDGIYVDKGYTNDEVCIIFESVVVPKLEEFYKKNASLRK